MKLVPFLAPYKVAILPLRKKNHSEKAVEILNSICDDFMCTYDDSGSIGKRYRRQDAIGTPFCVTVDDDTLEKGTVTVRDRDSMKQDVVKIEDLKNYVAERIRL